MDTYDQMLVDNRYPGDFDNDKYLSSNQSKTQQQIPNKDEDGNGTLGRRVYLESPSFGNKEEEDMYRYVSSRLTNHTSSVVAPTTLEPTGPTLMDSLDLELDILGAHNTRTQIPYRHESKPLVPQRQLPNTLTNMPRADPRQDPLLGPLLAELDTMSNQQQQLPPLPARPPPPPIYRRNSLPYESNFVRPVGSSQANHALTNVANRTVNDTLLKTELYDSLDPKDQKQQFSAPNINSLNYSPPQQQQQQPTRPLYMDGTDIFTPSSYPTGPGTFLSHFGPEDQLFQRPLLNSLGQNYVQNPRLPPPHRTTYAPPHLPPNEQPPLPPSNYQNTNQFTEYQRIPPQQHYEEQISRQTNSSNNHQLFFTDHNDDQIGQQQQQSSLNSQRSNDQQDQDSKRQAIWNDLQRTNAKFQEKNIKKHESPNRIKAPFGSNTTLNSSGSQQSSSLSKSPPRLFHHPPPISKSNYIEENIDMIKNKENFYHRYPAKKYENLYSKRKDLRNDNDNDKYEQESKNNSQRQSSLPVIVNLNTNGNPQNNSLPSTVTLPIDSHINRIGDKISVNIDLSLADLQNLRQQQQQASNHPQWNNVDPLDRHIRKLERNIDQSLPTTNPPQRNPVIPNTGVNPSIGRYGKPPTGRGRPGYNPPTYAGDYYNDKNREDDSYLAKMNSTKKHSQFKPYTGRDYEQFKKNYGFGTGHLGHDFDNTTYKEKVEKLNKTKQYAQQIEARNKKKLSDVSRRTLSETGLPRETSKPSRSVGYTQLLTRPKQYSGISTHSSPPAMTGIVPFIPARRPTEVLYRPSPLPRQYSKSPQFEDNKIIERLNINNQSDNVPVKNIINSAQKRRVRIIPNDNHHVNNIKRLTQDQRHLSPIIDNKRRPLKFDKLLLPDEPIHSSNIDQLLNKQQELVVVDKKTDI